MNRTKHSLNVARYIMDYSVVVPEEKQQYLDRMVFWLVETFGEPRPTWAFDEFETRYLDHFEGVWGLSHVPQPIFWFAKKHDYVLFTLTWM